MDRREASRLYTIEAVGPSPPEVEKISGVKPQTNTKFSESVT